MRSVVLVGFMGTGKSSVGASLARKLGFKTVDTDGLIEKEAGMTIPEIFEREGEKHFRDLEEKIISRITSAEDSVIITGGGVVLRDINMQNLKSCGKVVCLTASPEEIYRRVQAETHRPLLQTADPVKSINELLEVRGRFYAQADISIDTTDLAVEDVVCKIMEALN